MELVNLGKYREVQKSIEKYKYLIVYFIDGIEKLREVLKGIDGIVFIKIDL